MDTKRPDRVGETRSPEALDPVVDLRKQGREFQSTLRDEFLRRHRPEQSGGRVATAFGGRIIAQGPRAAEAIRHLLDLHRRSPSFRRALDSSLAQHDTVWITLGYGGGHSRATIGAADERVYINLRQGDLFDLLLHECGHALAKLPDGRPGEIGPNQRFQAQVKRELEMAGGMVGYGYEVRPHPPRTRGG